MHWSQDINVLIIMAISSLSWPQFPFPDLPVLPHHPLETYKFLEKAFGRTKVALISCKASWFRHWPHFLYNRCKICNILPHLCVGL